MAEEVQVLPIAAYISAANTHDATALLATFSDSAVVTDGILEFHGTTAVREWGNREIIEPQVTLNVNDVMQMGDETIVTTKVDGSYDKTYIPDPLFLDHHFTVCDNKIDTLMIQMAGEKPSIWRDGIAVQPRAPKIKKNTEETE